MSEARNARFDVEGYRTLAETPDLRVTILTLAAGQQTPWHYHTHVTDTFICLQGPMVVEAEQPAERHELAVGETCAVAPKRPHHVVGKGGGPCRYALVQGIGPYDAIPVNR